MIGRHVQPYKSRPCAKRTCAVVRA
jgi:hypothetical protein